MHYFTSFSSSFLTEKVVQFRSIHHCCNPSSDGEDLCLCWQSAYLPDLSVTFTCLLGEWAAPPAFHFLSVITALFTVIAHYYPTDVQFLITFMRPVIPALSRSSKLIPWGSPLTRWCSPTGSSWTVNQKMFYFKVDGPNEVALRVAVRDALLLKFWLIWVDQ